MNYNCDYLQGYSGDGDTAVASLTQTAEISSSLSAQNDSSADSPPVTSKLTTQDVSLIADILITVSSDVVLHNEVVAEKVSEDKQLLKFKLEFDCVFAGKILHSLLVCLSINQF